ncbi:MAG: AAA family ATPase [Anaerovoracaceae bacterium]|jgi:MoxR-like ATPase
MEKSGMDPAEVKAASQSIKAIVDNVEKVIIGKRSVIELCIMTMLSGGHVLIEDVPGVGKTSLISAISKTISCDFSRIQFTPDIMPSDVTGFSVFNQKTGEFEFRPGAIMSNIVLADEINRASAKTQAALLEAMEERQVTVDSNTYRLEEPFMVLATENPIDSFGTYPLPEAQIDRFLMKISVGYPTPDQEVRIAFQSSGEPVELGAVATGEDIQTLRKQAASVLIKEGVARYIVDIVTATRSHPDLVLGSSPRGTIAMYSACRAWALYHGRDYVTPDDVKYMAPHILPHRLILNHEAKIAGRTGKDVIDEILHRVIVPMGDAS